MGVFVLSNDGRRICPFREKKKKNAPAWSSEHRAAAGWKKPPRNPALGWRKVVQTINPSWPHSGYAKKYFLMMFHIQSTLKFKIVFKETAAGPILRETKKRLFKQSSPRGTLRGTFLLQRTVQPPKPIQTTNEVSHLHFGYQHVCLPSVSMGN